MKRKGEEEEGRGRGKERLAFELVFLIVLYVLNKIVLLMNLNDSL